MFYIASCQCDISYDTWTHVSRVCVRVLRGNSTDKQLKNKDQRNSTALENSITHNSKYIKCDQFLIFKMHATLIGLSLPAVIRASVLSSKVIICDQVCHQYHTKVTVLSRVHTSSHSAGFICSGMSVCPQLYNWSTKPTQATFEGKATMQVQKAQHCGNISSVLH